MGGGTTYSWSGNFPRNNQKRHSFEAFKTRSSPPSGTTAELVLELPASWFESEHHILGLLGGNFCENVRYFENAETTRTTAALE
jgi:hypothetical protein